MSHSSVFHFLAYKRTADGVEARRNYEYDLERFLKHSSTRDFNPDPIGLESFLTSAYHAIEKGLAMEMPRPGFAERHIPLIIAAIVELERGGHACFATRGARGCLQAYVRFHDSHGFPLPAHLEAQLRTFVAEMSGRTLPGGSITLTRKDIEGATDLDYARFVRTRYSVRQFTGESVSPDAIRRAVDLAIKTPRTCNREMRRVYAVYEPNLRDHLLTFQDGNRGFGHKLGAVLIVAADVRELYEIHERNQAWIDGGLFAMSLVYALHAARLGTCMLNWSVDCEQDQLLRKEFNIADHEVIVTFIGVGQLKDTFEVAASPAPSVDDILSVLSVN
ncbi:nitroreductase family protein [Rhizobium gallicum]|uniref:nitroreductase family protein n=1 Tax=Rhizobium gallicum TaxID=56730 RepID=UPI001EF7FEF6|nr:nitroreductase family protein [Rhizobium gallicum]ULJ74274.1 nitroreductase family protein [Rhizobium gallicum]